MILKALKYTRYAGEAHEWSIVGKEDETNNSYAYFGNINLLVGKNAAGKSRALDAIRQISNLFAGRIGLEEVPYSTEKFELMFEEGDVQYEYLLDFKKRIIIDEKLTIGKTLVLDRSKGLLKDTSIGRDILANIKDTTLAATLTDEEGKPIFAPLVSWGGALRNFLFSNQQEKNRLARDYKMIEKEDQDIEDTSILVHTFYKGKEEFGESFISEIKADMQDLGYNITNVDIQQTKRGYGICVEEDGKYIVSQREMSQGMFRTLSLFIQLIYVRLSKQSLCVLVDDMGEGLDYDRSKGLVNIFIKKLNQPNIQFFLTTNDRYVMNKVPLRYWTVIDRDKSSRSVFYNYENSKDVFEDFRYTGLNNFDFFTTDFYSKGFGNMEDEEE